MNLGLPHARRAALGAVSALLALWTLTAHAQPRPPVTPPPASSALVPQEAAAAPSAPSASSQRLFEAVRGSLLQVRVLLKSQSSQRSVGSGFFAGPNRIVTNYHVVSDYALEPDRYQLTYQLADGRTGPLDLLAIDVRHDLAVVALSGDAAAAARVTGVVLPFRPAALPLARGEPIYSMGNPLDVGFAVVSGTYNGLVERSYYPNIFFGGALSAGMSGGPAVDSSGRVIGINVATRRDGQQVSFLVPAAFAQDLLARSAKAQPLRTSAYPEVTRQLMAHQEALTQRFLHMPWRTGGDTRYRIPVPQEEFMRCWGSGSSPESKGLQYQRTDCMMESGLFINESLTLMPLYMRHESYDGSQLGALRFARQYSLSLRNESLYGGRATTPMQCVERLVDANGLTARGVVCLAAYKKLKGLYKATVLVAPNDRARHGFLGRFDMQGFSLSNALALTDHYLRGFAPVHAAPQPASHAASAASRP